MIEIMEIREICKAIVVCDSISASRPKQDMQFFLTCYVKALARIVVHSLCAAVEIVCGVWVVQGDGVPPGAQHALLSFCCFFEVL